MTHIKYVRGKYVEDGSFLCLGHPEPHIRHQELVFYSQESRWTLKVTFMSEAIQRQFTKGTSDDTCVFVREPIKKYLERRQEFQSFIKCINFHELNLIPDTVTEINLVLESPESKSPTHSPLHLVEDIAIDTQNRFLMVASALKATIQEDPLRIKYPAYAKDSTLPEVSLEDILTEEDFNGSAFRVKRAGKSQSYVYKKVDRPFYNPYDTWVFLNELKNLKLLRGKSHIVQLCHIVVSTNPYQTIPTRVSPLVIRGILLEHHPLGTLEDRLQNADLEGLPWKMWPLHIGYGLLHLHRHGITHMDLKPSNIVIDIHGNALLIDISGVGGITLEWTSPELQEKDYLNVPHAERALSDIWAYGRIMFALAQSRNWGDEVTFLREAVAATTNEDPEMRIGLRDVISMLQNFEERWI